ncbi:16S rRNA (cytosine(967)-C(5))-methyltransferase RsmB [Pradoshia sp. D12]|uniref:16S rRNA (cytosine(967)-C(5))-methyltransferase RsmB n=1 Tax=Bacillaceae TaxID=186817 RepID=UPI00112EC306|nr:MULTISPECIES: 16S rRNA (cytosine(967)-C(5))-methyltransferase RsmB [Bacillaceae]QFK70931.1 16S rRNA (cytosine(967)-C(5))-methyltransferase RsmB [Pradoshia sp. D12]TPF72723.1 16S rRNA (cytosine(967)-C(5))-methyltransferase RsmB [Bacillus sp. D12]
MPQKKNVREVALDILVSVEKSQAYSNLSLNHAIKENELSPQDVGLLTELTYGTIQRKMTLEYYVKPFIKNPKKLQSWVLLLIEMTVFQMFYLDRVPDRAAIHEAVEIAKKRGHRGIASLVNGVLRSIQRDGVPSLDDIKDPLEKISVSTSHPLWLVRKWAEEFGVAKTKEMCEENLHAPVQTGRVNLTKISREELMEKLKSEGYMVEPSLLIEEGIRCLKGNMALSASFKEGLFSIQDESSMLVAYALAPKENDTILDSCAAPGGKTMHMAEKMNDTGQIYALDLHAHKTKLIDMQAKRLGLSNIVTKQMDARKTQEFFETEMFDKVLVDAPCSGLGVLKRKPDAKYTKSENDLSALAKIQFDILHQVSQLVKKGGTIVYSTCTVGNDENNDVIDAFIQAHPEFEKDLTLKERMPEPVRPYIMDNSLQVLPQYFGSDGFFIASIRKKA